MGLSLVLGGAIGNLVDRLMYGKVIDFIDVYFDIPFVMENYHFAMFNVADMAITGGAMLAGILEPVARIRWIKIPSCSLTPCGGGLGVGGYANNSRAIFTCSFTCAGAVPPSGCGRPPSLPVSTLQTHRR